MISRAELGLWSTTPTVSAAGTAATSGLYWVALDSTSWASDVATWASTTTTSTTLYPRLWRMPDWVRNPPFRPQAPHVWRQMDRTLLSAEEQAEVAQNLIAVVARRQEVERRNEGERAAAQARARELLLSFLSIEQRIEYEQRRTVTVEGQHARYRLTAGRVANIEVIREERLVHRLCVHPENAHEMPVEDVMLSQLLHLRADEAALVSRANVHRLLAA